MKENTIYIRQDEEITSVVDRLIKTSTNQVLLVVPQKAVITQSLVNLKLLKREADNLRKVVTIITQEPAVQRLAKRANFLVRESLPEPERSSLPEGDVLKEQIPANEFEDLLKKEKRPGALRIVDIVGGPVPLGRVVTKKIKDISKKEAEREFEKEEAEPTKQEVQPKIKTAPGTKRWPETTRQEPISIPYKFKDGEIQEHIIPSETAKLSEVEEQLPSATKILIPSFSVKIFGMFVFAALVIAGLVFYFVLPKAEISLRPKKENLFIDLQVLADKNASRIDPGLNKIPAQLIKMEERMSAEFPTSGQRQLNEKAKGEITVFNAYSSSPQTLVETTRFLSPEGKVFRLTKTITIPGAKIEEARIVASSIEVEVEADQPGDDYNIGPSDFTIPGFKGSPKYTGFYGKSSKPMSGGSTEIAKIFIQDDLDKSKQELWDNLQGKINEELASQIPKEFIVLEGATQIEMAEIKPSLEIGGKGDKFTLTIKGTAKGLIFSQADIFQLLKENFLDELSDKKQLANDVSLKYSDIKPQFDKGQITFRVEGNQQIIWQIDEQKIKELIAGKNESEVRQIFSQRAEIENAQVSLWPFWLKKIPSQPNKIKIKQITVD